ncbi:MAG: hypothetical protein LBI96_05040, partial [Odoribacteraceae bacterium]|nr:hypothetical protein [Odoribacteraceae bacterium]
MTNKNFRQTIIALFATIMALTSCDKQDNYTPAAGEETNMKLNISFPEQATRATTDANATADELKVTTIDVFIFDEATKKLENRVRLAEADIDKDPDSDTYNSKTSVTIRATIGKKLVAAGINLPSSFPSITTTGQLTQAWAAGLSDLKSSNGLVMFSGKMEAPELVAQTSPDYAAKNTIAIQVKRAVAKVAVQDGGFDRDLTVGSISAPAFAMRNANRQTFPMQVIENGIVKDPNWLDTSYPSTDFENFS